MKRTVSIHQPLYFPWLGYFFKIGSADEFVFLDDAQFVKNGIVNRNRIWTRQGIKWLSIPVKNRLGQAINETKFSDPRWRRRHLQTLRSVYGRSPGFRHIYPPLAELLEREDWPNLAAINIAVVQHVCEFLKIPVPTLCASSLGLEGKADRRVVKIIRALGGDTYLSGRGGANYQSIENFEPFGIQLEYLKYPDFNYPRSSVGIEGSNRSEFQQPLSVLDFLFTCGDESRERFSSFLRCSG